MNTAFFFFLFLVCSIIGQAASTDDVPEGLAKSDWQSIRAVYEAGRHAFQQVPGKDGVWQARNPGQQWLTTFDQRGFEAQPQNGGWSWGLELHSYGFGEKQIPISGSPTVKAEGQRLSYQWDAAVQEWWVNDQRGLEHGFTVAQRPHLVVSSSASRPVTPPLVFTLSTRGNLRPTITADSQGVLFQDATGATVLNYTGLKVWDADGKPLASHFEAAGETRVRLLVDERTARYPITIDPIAHQAYLKASNTGGESPGNGDGDGFGWSVAISGNTVVVGAYFEGSNATGVNAAASGGTGTQADNSARGSGAAYVFTRNGTTWSQQAYLKASNTEAYDSFGWSVAISVDTVVVGAINEASNATGVNATVSGGTGTQADNSAPGSGAAYVFTRNGTSWSQQAYLKASNTGTIDQFGSSVAVSGDIIIVGAYGESSNATGINAAVSGGTGTQADNSAAFSGAAYVFTRTTGVWSQEAYLKASNTGEDDNFGYSVAVAGDTAVVGAYGDDSNATGVNAAVSGGTGTQADNSADLSGATYVFVRGDGVWSQQAYLKASNTGASDQFGWSVAINGDSLVVGALNEASNATGVNAALLGGAGTQADNSASGSGAAYVFKRSGGLWVQEAYLKASNNGTNDLFGWSVAVADDTLVVTAIGESSNATGVNAAVTGGSGTQADNSSSNSGAAYIFNRSAGQWHQQVYLKASNTGAFDDFGSSAALSRDAVIIGSRYEASNATGVGGSQTNNSAAGSGAAYIFSLSSLPRVSISPGDTIVSVGQSLTLTSSSGSGYTYQWRRNGTSISKATNSTLVLTNLQRTQEGVYDVVVKNAFGVAVSNAARLSFPPLVPITAAPQSTTVNPLSTATFTVDVPGATAWQWLKNGVAIKGAITSTLNVPNVDASSAGLYSVTVTTPNGKVTTAPAQLRINDSGLLIYKLTGTGKAYAGTVATNAALSGYLVLDRSGQRGGLIIGSKSGSQNIHRLEIHDDLDTQSTGPVPKTQTVVSELVAGEFALWMDGTDGLLTISKTDKAVGPATMKGFANSIDLGSNVRIETVSLTLALDAVNSTPARLHQETVEQAMSRISQDMQAKGSALVE
jgi:hypothetical protein